ncbi:MAG: metallophosphoesterase [Clostridia bacterium]|nr:metallophosphoesterase [Clostridia bacterium]
MKITYETLKTPLKKTYHFLLLSDLHSALPRGFLRTLSALTPDFIIMAGDMVDGSLQEAPHMLSLLAGAAAIAPTYYATGNHEAFTDGDIELISSLGIAFLDNNDSTYEEIRIGGLSSGFGHSKPFHKTPAPDLAFLDRFSSLDSYKLLIAHHPEWFPSYIKNRAIDLTLSGHAHGGQWRIAGRGIFAPGQGLFPKYTSGLYTEGKSSLIVSRGLGSHSVIPRINNSPEIVVITLEGIGT